MNPQALPLQLLSSENPFLQVLVDALPDMVAVKDNEGQVRVCNKAWAAALGANSPSEVVGKTNFDFLPAPLASQYQADEQSVVISKCSSTQEEEVSLPGIGHSTWFESTQTPLIDGSGTIMGVVVIKRDITSERRVQKAWSLALELEERSTEEFSKREAEVTQAHNEREQALQLLQALLDNIPDIIYFKDAQSRFIKCSKAQADRLGLEDADMAIGKTDFDFHPPERASEFYQDEQRVIQTGEPLINKIERKTRPNGVVFWTSTTKVPLREKDGRIVGIVGVNRDITEQMRAEEIQRQAHEELERHVAERTADLSNERRLLRTLIDNLPDAIYAKDIEGRKTLANRADLKNLQCEKEVEALGKTDFDLFPREIASRFWADDQTVLQSGKPVLNREEYFLDAEGRKRWLLSSKLPLHDERGKTIGLIGIGRDITSLKEAELKLESVHKQLVGASRQAGMAEVATGVLHNVGNVLNSLNVSAALMSEKLRGSKTAGVSKLAALIQEHRTDLGQYLTSDERGKHLPGYVIQLAGHLEQERAEMIAEINCLSEHIGHIKQIVTTQQNYARVAGLVEKVALPDLVDDSMKINGAAYLRHGIRIVYDYDAVPEILVDKHRVMQVLVNLLSNAKYACDRVASGDRQVTIRLKNAGVDRVKIEVADNGMGVAPENLTRIFSQGFTTRKEGHGFGLHSGALAAKEMGGSLTVTSAGVGLGATFTLELPIAPAEGKR